MKKKSNFQKIKKIFICFSSLFILLLGVYACRKSMFIDSTKSQDINILSNSNNTYNTSLYDIEYKSNITVDSILHINLKITAKHNKYKSLDETFDIDFKGQKFYKTIYNIFSKKSQASKYSEFSLIETKLLCRALRSMISQTVKTLSIEEIKSPKIQGLYMSLSFTRMLVKNKMNINSIETYSKNKMVASNEEEPVEEEMPSYNQDVYEGTVRGLSPFIFNDDIVIIKQSFQSMLSEDLLSYPNDNMGMYVFQEALNNISSSTFTLKDFLSEIDNYRTLHPELASGAGWWPSGSSHGCCGNYSGPCYYWHPICYIHDKLCAKCTPKWFCLSGCVPDPAHSEDDNPFTFIENTPIINSPIAPTFNTFLTFFNIPLSVIDGEVDDNYSEPTISIKLSQAKFLINSFNVYITPALSGQSPNLSLEQRKSYVADYLQTNNITLSNEFLISLYNYMNIVYHHDFVILIEEGIRFYDINLIDFNSGIICYGIRGI